MVWTWSCQTGGKAENHREEKADMQRVGVTEEGARYRVR